VLNCRAESIAGVLFKINKIVVITLQVYFKYEINLKLLQTCAKNKLNDLVDYWAHLLRLLGIFTLKGGAYSSNARDQTIWLRVKFK